MYSLGLGRLNTISLVLRILKYNYFIEAINCIIVRPRRFLAGPDTLTHYAVSHEAILDTYRATS